MINEKYLQEFAYLNDTAYLDVCSVGLQPRRTLDHCRAFQQEFVDSFGRICFGPYGQRRHEVAVSICRLIGADLPGDEDNGEILFTGNTTEGDNLLVDCLELQAGDSVISSNIEYPSVVLGWAMKQKEGIELRLVPAKNGCLEADDIIAAMDETTRVVSLSFVQYHTGFKADLKKIGTACRERGILFLVDGIQGVGRNEINVKEMCIDVLACGGFKALMAPFGTAFVYIRKDLIPRLRPRWYSENNVQVDEDQMEFMKEFPVFDLQPGISALEGGSKNTYGITALGKNIDLLLEIGIDNIHAHIMELERHFRARLKKASLPLTILGSADEQYWSGTVCIRYDEAKTELLQQQLADANIYACVHSGFLRISMHYYNTIEQMDRAAVVLEKVFAE